MYLNEKGKELLRRVLSAERAPGRPLGMFSERTRESVAAEAE